jgi:hypothetical protein|tara:strand:- start:2966 stop:3466 length:501 start_codon:yes stop_codon:yes gene_type:complete
MSFQYSNRIVDPMGLVERSSGVIDPFIFVPRTPRGPILKDGGMVPMPTLPKITGPSMPEFPDILGGSIPMPELPRGGASKESCAECRSRQNPYEMNIVDPCMNQCSGGGGGVFRLPDMPFPRGEDRFPSQDFELLNFPKGGGSSIPDYIVPAAQLLGTFLGKILNK